MPSALPEPSKLPAHNGAGPAASGSSASAGPVPPSLDNPHDIGNPPSRLPLRAQQVMVGVFVLGFVVATLFAVTEHWRRACFTLGAAMLWLTACRLTCDSQVMGLLAVRSRRFDAMFATTAGAGLVWLAVSVDSLGS
ncbi:DUF3017 domain-containing protein [Corynebacterium sp. P3-F1]|uniref:DUF3017 domain-containing protein n=1 Tax=Corynebacterium sp. P3-F1 TaxID=3059080 RepID=UPI003464F436